MRPNKRFTIAMPSQHLNLFLFLTHFHSLHHPSSWIRKKHIQKKAATIPINYRDHLQLMRIAMCKNKTTTKRSLMCKWSAAYCKWYVHLFGIYLANRWAKMIGKMGALEFTVHKIHINIDRKDSMHWKRLPWPGKHAKEKEKNSMSIERKRYLFLIYSN